jgi:hypothetical protein
MAVQIWRKRQADDPALDPADDRVTVPADDTTRDTTPSTTRRVFSRRTAGETTAARPRIFNGRRVTDAEPQTVLVDRKTARRWRRHRRNPISNALWTVALTAAAVLGLGMLLTWSDANQANDVVHAIMRLGTWLATPFHDVFSNSDAKHQLYENWGLTAGVYLVVGRALSWLIRW